MIKSIILCSDLIIVMFKRLNANINLNNVNPPNKSEIDYLVSSKFDLAFKAIGLSNKVDKRLWFSDFDEFGLKNVIRFQLTKGLGAVFVFGKCFNFVPTISTSGRLIRHRTDKSTTLHLFDYSNDIKSKKLLGKKRRCEINLLNQNLFINDLDFLKKNGIDFINDWFKINQNVEQCIQTSLEQISLKGHYLLHSPNQLYVLAFLHSKVGNLIKSKEFFTEYMNYNKANLSFETENKIKSELGF